MGDSLRDRIAAAVAGNADDGFSMEDWIFLAEVVIEALDLADPCATGGCRLRRIAREGFRKYGEQRNWGWSLKGESAPANQAKGYPVSFATSPNGQPMSDNLFKECDDIHQLIHQLVGLSSVCWVGGTTGEFDTTQALKAASHALTRLNELGCRC